MEMRLMLKIRYDPFHLGLKVNTSIIAPKEFFKLKNRLLESLRTLGYPDVSSGRKTLLIEQLNANELLSRIEDTEIIVNNIAAAINVRGSNPEIVLEQMLIIEKELVINYDVERIKAFYEIIADMEVKTNSNPEEIFTKQINFQEIKTHSGESVNLSAMVLSSDLAFRNTDKWFNLSISPNPLNPKTSYAIHLVARFNSLKETKKNILSLYKQISKILTQLGDENAISA